MRGSCCLAFLLIRGIQHFSDTLTVVPIRRVARGARCQRNVDRNSFRSPHWGRDSGSVQPRPLGSTSVKTAIKPGVPSQVCSQRFFVRAAGGDPQHRYVGSHIPALRTALQRSRKSVAVVALCDGVIVQNVLVRWGAEELAVSTLSHRASVCNPGSRVILFRRSIRECAPDARSRSGSDR